MRRQSKTEEKIPLEDHKIIDLYWNRDETAIKETDYKYKKYLYSIIYNVLEDNHDCEECLNDTYLGAWNAIPPTVPRSLKAFLCVIARRSALKLYNNKSKQRAVPSEMTSSLSELENIIYGDGDVEAEFDAKRLGKVISNFVCGLSERRQFIFMSRYYAAEPIDNIARELELSRSMVNKELASIRSALKEKLESEGYSI